MFTFFWPLIVVKIMLSIYICLWLIQWCWCGFFGGDSHEEPPGVCCWLIHSDTWCWDDWRPLIGDILVVAGIHCPLVLHLYRKSRFQTISYRKHTFFQFHLHHIVNIPLTIFVNRHSKCNGRRTETTGICYIVIFLYNFIKILFALKINIQPNWLHHRGVNSPRTVFAYILFPISHLSWFLPDNFGSGVAYKVQIYWVLQGCGQ